MVLVFASGDVAVKAKFAAFYAALIWQALRRRSDLASRALRLFKGVAASYRGQSGGPRSDEDTWAREQLDELRLQSLRRIFRFALAFCVHIQVLLSIFWDSLIEHVGLSHLRRMQNLFLANLLITYAVCFGWVSLTPRRVRCMWVSVSIPAILRILMDSADPAYCYTSGMRAAFRGLVTIGSLDWRTSALINLSWSVAVLRGAVGDPDDFRLPLFSEIVTLAFLVFLGWFVEETAMSFIKLNLGELFSKSVQRAFRRLLAVLCDAELQLTDTFEVHDPTSKVAHLLAPSSGVAGRSLLDGRPFADFVAEADRKRLTGFLSAGSAPAEPADGADAEPTPARSLQVQLCDTDGRDFAVELFHVDVPLGAGRRRSGHLLGIRECEPVPGEASAAAEPTGPTLGPGRPARPAAGDGEAGSRASSRRSFHSFEILERSLELPEFERMDIRVSALDEDLAIREARFRFRIDPTATVPQRLPRLTDFVDEEAGGMIKRWLHRSLNSVMYGEECRWSSGPLVFRWPSSRGEQDEDLVLKASELALRAPEEENNAEEEEEQNEEKEEGEGEEKGEQDEPVQKHEQEQNAASAKQEKQADEEEEQRLQHRQQQRSSAPAARGAQEEKTEAAAAAAAVMGDAEKQHAKQTAEADQDDDADVVLTLRGFRHVLVQHVPRRCHQKPRSRGAQSSAARERAAQSLPSIHEAAAAAK